MHGHGGSTDPATRFIEQMVADTVGPIAQRRGAQGGTNGAGSERERGATFLPVTPVPAIVAVAAVEADEAAGWMIEHASSFPATHQVVSVLTELSPWSSLAVTATAGAVVLDGFRWTAFRHRRAITNQVQATTYTTPKRVWVRWPAGLVAPRHVIVKLPPGSVIPDKRYDAFCDAVTKHANRYRGDSLARRIMRGREWTMDVEWQAGSSRLIITRRAPAEALAGASDQHKRLAGLLDEKFPLPGAHINGIERDESGVEIGYTISYKPTIAAALPAFQQRLREALIGSLPPHVSERDWSVAVHPETDLIRIGLAAPLPAGAVHHTPLSLAEYRSLTEDELYKIPFAVGAQDQMAYWNIGKKSSGPHILLAGKTGGGKTSLIRSLLTEMIARGVPVAGAIDVKMLELDGFETFPGVAAVVYNIREIVALINAVYAEMMARNAFVHRVRIDESFLPKFAFVLDEFFVMSAFLKRAQGYKGDDPEAAELAALVKNSNPMGKISEILALVRSAQGRIILGVQRPDTRNFGDDAGSVRDNFGSRASLSNLSMDGAQMMWDDAHIGRDVDTSVPGRATVADTAGNPMHAQVLWTPNPDDHPNRWRRLSATDQQLVADLREAALAGADIAGDYLPEIRDELDRIDGIVPAPAGGPPMACFSVEMRDFLISQRESIPQPPSVVAGIDPTTAGDEGVRAGALTAGNRIHLDDDGHAMIATVAAVKANKTRVTVKLRDESNPRVTHTAEFAPDDFVLTADATEESLYTATNG